MDYSKSKYTKIMKTNLMELPTPSRISYSWNFGSLLGLTLVIQIVTGLLLSLHYCAEVSVAFNRVDHIMRDVNFG